MNKPSQNRSTPGAAPGVVVAGTAVGVGKTVVAAGLAAAARARGRTVAAFKQVETGCPVDETGDAVTVDGLPEPVDSEAAAALNRLAALAGPPPAHFVAATPQASLLAEDSHTLCRAAGDHDPPLAGNIYRFAPPLEPAVCARLAHRTIDLDRVVDGCQQARQAPAEFAVVEACHGLFAPLTPTAVQLDLIARLDMMVLLVMPTAGEAIDAGLAALDALDRRGIPLAGVVLNRIDPTPRPEEAATPFWLEAFHPDTVLGALPHFDTDPLSTPEGLDHLASRFPVHIDVDRIFN